MKRKNVPVPGSAVAYGETVYWITIISAFLVLVGTVQSFIDTPQILSPSYMINSVLDGNSVQNIWMNSAFQAMPENHWYLFSIGSGEGLTTLGIATGVFSVIPATAIATFFFWRSNNRIFSMLSFFACVITFISMAGWISMPI